MGTGGLGMGLFRRHGGGTLPRTHMLVLAHRGCHVRAPHNSMDAFSDAVTAGADGIETDVRISRDGFPVLMHDRVVGGRAVSALAKADMESVLGYPVPTLDEALARFPHLIWNVEIKTRDAVERTVDALRRFGSSRFLITSFRHDAVAMAALQLGADCGLLVAERPLSLEGLLSPAAPLPRLRTLVWDYEILDVSMVNEARSRGWRNFAYGMETAEEHRLCVEVGLDGIITDHIELGLKAR